MTKEQEKAILYLEYMNKNIDFNKIGYVYAKEMIETVLNTLEEKDELYHKALGDLVKADREIIQLNRQIDLMAEQIKIPEPTMKIESFDIKPKTKFGMRYLNKEEVKQYFKEIAERKSEEWST